MDFFTILFTLAVVCVVFVLIFGKENIKTLLESLFLEEDTENAEVIEENVTFALEKFGKTPRPTWSEMPEVSSSGILKIITSHEIQLHELMFEIITSEATYLNSLKVLDQVFAKSEEFSSNEPGKCILTKQERHVIFSNTEDIRKTSERFLSELASSWRKSIKLLEICDIIQKHASNNFSCYVLYCSNQEYQNRTATALKKRPDYLNALATLEKHEDCKSLSLTSFLILPVQRVPRLLLLVAAICERVDKIDDEKRRKSDLVANENRNNEKSSIKKSAMCAMKALNKVARQSDDAVRRMQQTEQMISLDKKIDFPLNKMAKIPLISASRYLVKQGAVTKIVNEASNRIIFSSSKPSKKIRHIFLFTDVLLITKKKGDRYKVTDYIQRNKLVIEEIDNVDTYTRVLPHGVPSGCSNLFLLVMLENCEKRQVEEVYACDSASDRARWVEALTPLKITENEQIYENWDCPQVKCVKRYVAKESDELTLELLDVVNVFKKLKDGMFEGERIRDGERGWFPSNHTVEIENDHVRARNTRMKYKLMSATENYGRSKRIQEPAQKIQNTTEST
ncbi:ephexin-1-like [Mercenaria mercenaria]|uniref:ephexin-1-like n=1 Tax=Mercenaria mercenaria TaxID=6596 RepID=UPI00234EA4DB|nr:ephexin-1-like [Mercenaria mercenaria]XP_053378138.1 ephexin-1-like [Mercenaria mercenaria]XP_053378139.1 ephexin-1-like [Mercenaria mercenaria]XP_053378140.1 ephexin-1-like [Mercenaria mercenaria]